MRKRQQAEAQAGDYPVFVGIARAEEGMTAPSIEEALANAYEQGKKATGLTRYRVVDIVVSGTNPINEYKVVLTPTP